MRSGEAHGWLFAGLVNDHLSEHTPDEWDKNWLAKHDRMLSPLTDYCPKCCGPCRSLRDYWNTSRGRAEAQTYLSALSEENREWTWAPDGVIDWGLIEDWMNEGFCPNHEGEDRG